MKNKRNRPTPSQNGYSLIELIIVIGIAAFSLNAFMTYQRLKLDRLMSVREAQVMQEIGKAAVDYLNIKMYEWDQISPSTTSFAIDITALQQANSCGIRSCLNSNFKNNTFWGGKYKLTYSRQNTVSTDFIYAVTIATVSGTGTAAITRNNKTRVDLASYAAQNVGNGIGYTIGISGVAKAVAPFGTWEIASSSIEGSMIETYASNPIGGQLYFYYSQTSDPSAKHYIKRNGVSPMLGNLNLGGKGIYGINYGVGNPDITSSTSTSSSNLFVTDSAQINGVSTFNNNVTALSLAAANAGTVGKLEANGTLNISGATSLNSSLSVNLGASMSTVDSISTGSNVILSSSLGDTKMASLTTKMGTNSITDATPNLVEINSFLVGDGSNVAPPSCGSGGSARIFVIPSSAIASVKAGKAGYIFSAVGPPSGPWVINAKDSAGNSLSGASIALARTFCSY